MPNKLRWLRLQDASIVVEICGAGIPNDVEQEEDVDHDVEPRQRRRPIPPPKTVVERNTKWQHNCRVEEQDNREELPREEELRSWVKHPAIVELSHPGLIPEVAKLFELSCLLNGETIGDRVAR